MFKIQALITATIVLVTGDALAQEVSLSPGTAASVSATSNRDRLADGLANPAVFSTVVGTLGLEARFIRAEFGAEYRGTFLQPLLEFGSEGDGQGALEHDHALGATFKFQSTERLSFELGLNSFFGSQTIRVLGASASVLDGDEELFEDGAAPVSPTLIGARNRVFVLESSVRSGFVITPEDRIFGVVSMSGRRDFAPDALGQEIEIEVEDRDTLGYRIESGWDRLFSPSMVGRLSVGTERTVFSQNLDTSQTWFGKAGVRHQVDEGLAWSTTGGASLTRARETGVDGEQAPTLLPALELAAALEAGSPNLGGSLGYARGIATSGVVGDTLLADAVAAEAFYRVDVDVIARVRASAALSRPAFGEQQGLGAATKTLGAAATLAIGMVDWLALDVSYSYEGQLGGSQELETSVTNDGGVVVVHTVLVGLIARTALTPRGRRLKEEGGLLR